MPNELLATLIGGGLSLAGTVITLIVQQRNARREKARYIRILICEQLDYLQEIIGRLQNKFEGFGQIWIEEIDQIEFVLTVFTRNAEQVVFLDNANLQKEIRDVFTSIFYASRRAKIAQQRLWELEKLDRQNFSEKQVATLSDEVSAASNAARRAVADIKAFATGAAALRSKLRK